MRISLGKSVIIHSATTHEYDDGQTCTERQNIQSIYRNLHRITR